MLYGNPANNRSLTMSWRWEILTDQWMTNGLRFATKEEAEASVFDLTKGFYETRVTETDDPVNYGWVDGKAVPLNPNCESCGVELESDPPQDDEFTCWCHQCNVKRTAQPQLICTMDLRADPGSF